MKNLFTLSNYLFVFCTICLAQNILELSYEAQHAFDKDANDNMIGGRLIPGISLGYRF